MVAWAQVEPRLVRVAVVVENVVQAVVVAVLLRLGRHRPMIIPFVAHGTPERARVGARVILGRPVAGARPVPAVDTAVAAPVAPAEPTTRSRRAVLAASLSRFLAPELPRVPVSIRTPGGTTTVRCDREGYLDAVVDLPGLAPGWHELELSLETGHPVHPVPVRLLVVDPEARLAVVSDIDDTILETGLTRGLAFLRATLLTDVDDRAPLPGAAPLYRALAADPGGEGRPVFYVSTSPWNLHEMLLQFLQLRGFPIGPLFLTDWGPGHGRLLRVGSQEHKVTLIRRILEEHPALRLLLIGDSGQADPAIYAVVAAEHPERIVAVYIRRTPGARARSEDVDVLAARVSAAGVPMLVVDDSLQIAVHAASLGLLDEAAVARVRAETP